MQSDDEQKHRKRVESHLKQIKYLLGAILLGVLISSPIMVKITSTLISGLFMGLLIILILYVVWKYYGSIKNDGDDFRREQKNHDIE